MQDILHENGWCNQCEELNVNCYEKIMAEMGYECCSGEGHTVTDICSEYSDNIVLMRLEGHMTCCVNGNCYDIWDCTQEVVDKYWIIG